MLVCVFVCMSIVWWQIFPCHCKKWTKNTNKPRFETHRHIWITIALDTIWKLHSLFRSLIRCVCECEQVHLAASFYKTTWKKANSLQRFASVVGTTHNASFIFFFPFGVFVCLILLFSFICENFLIPYGLLRLLVYRSFYPRILFVCKLLFFFLGLVWFRFCLVSHSTTKQ